MSRLIPFRLRSSVDLNTEEVPTSSTSHSSTTSFLHTSPTSALKSPARQRRPGPVTDLIIQPYTQEEWTKVMEEAKELYVKRQYKQCSARCIQVLNGIKDPYRVHPLHSIYLSFYAASSLELTAGPLHVNSSNKLPLLQQSLAYYKNAESCMEFATFSADPTIVQAARRRSSSISSSIRSSMDSVFSQTPSNRSACSSVSASPTFSFCELNSENEKGNNHPPSSSISIADTLLPAPLRVRKKVSFYPKVPTVKSEADLTGMEDQDIIDSFPTPPNSTPPTQSKSSDTSLSSYLLSRSLARYRDQLSALHVQLAYHIGSVSAQIHTLQTCRKARRSNLPNLFTTDFTVERRDGLDREEMKRVELRSRIERLRGAGWRRERFSGARYQLLAEKTIGELD